MRRWGQKLVVVLATGYVLFFYSERVFWSFLRPGDKPADFILGWLVYSLLAWVFLLLVRVFRIAAFPGTFVAGAVFGWLAEGVVVDTLYGSPSSPFPTSISFTGLAWHALISVGIGWYWQARVLAGAKMGIVAIFAAAVGIGWGLWAAWWPAELGRASTTLAALASHTVACFIPFLGAWIVLGMAGSDWFRPAKLEFPVLLGLVGLFFVGVRVPATPRSVFILPPLLLLCGYGLWRSRREETRPDLMEEILGHIPARACLPLLLMPATAIGVYALVAAWGQSLPTNWVPYWITMPLGFLSFVGSLWILHRGKPGKNR